MHVSTAQHGLALLEQLGAPRRLIVHHELVVEAARELVSGLARFASSFDASVVLSGAALHDAGKILHPQELDVPGALHEPSEDLLVALADKLWKGKRVAELERRIVEALAAKSELDFWETFVRADDLFERIAARGDERLSRSR